MLLLPQQPPVRAYAAKTRLYRALPALPAGHGLAGDKAAQYAGKGVLRHMSNNALLRSATNAASLNDVNVLHKILHTAFLKGHACGLDLYNSPPASVVYTKAKG